MPHWSKGYKMNWRAKLKARLCRWLPLLEFCHRCGRQVGQVWWCKDDALWKKVSGKHGCLCIRCFDELAGEQRILVQWTAKEHD